MEAEAMEFGGLRVPSVNTENLESFHGAALRGEPGEPRDDKLLRLSLVDPLDVEVRVCFTASGMPSHLELTLGTVGGSFWPTKFIEALDCGEVLPAAAFCLRCCSANCSRATWDGSFRERKPSTELVFFFFFDDDFESLEEERLGVMEARLDDVTLAVSKDG